MLNYKRGKVTRNGNMFENPWWHVLQDDYLYYMVIPYQKNTTNVKDIFYVIWEIGLEVNK